MSRQNLRSKDERKEGEARGELPAAAAGITLAGTLLLFKLLMWMEVEAAVV